MQVASGIKKLGRNARIALGILIFLTARDTVLIAFPIYERSPIAFWLGLVTVTISLIGTIIGFEAMWRHWRDNKKKFFSTISLELMVCVSVPVYIALLLLCYR